MHKSEERRNLITVSNAVELIVQASMEYMGTKHTSQTPTGGTSTRQAIADAATARIGARLSIHLGDKA